MAGLFSSVMGFGIQSVINERLQAFIERYKDVPNFFNYTCVDGTGSNSCSMYILFLIVPIFISIFIVGFISNKYKDNDKSEDAQSDTYKFYSNIMGYLFIALLASIVFYFIVYGFYYINYLNWLSNLTANAPVGTDPATELLQIWSLKRVQQQTRQNFANSFN
tara:strand:+ start:43 stop:531 length:489 start_codon:yes stop_codon:yes gene_type:complete